MVGIWGMRKYLDNKKPKRDRPLERVERLCLACGKRFEARGRYERLCREHRHGEGVKEGMG